MTALLTDRVELLEHLGGHRATVHRAVERRTGLVVVVKRAPWDHPDAVDALGREAGILQRVSHPSVIRLVDVVEDHDGRTLVLRHAPGGSLRDVVAHHGPLAAHEVADTGARLAAALAALHRAGVVHRDVHPGNVLLDAELQPLLADLDHALDDEAAPLPLDRDVVGHPAHVDHRLFAGAPAGPASDLHALATTLWTAATGTAPPRSGPRAPVDLAAHPLVPPPLHDVLTACVDGTIGDAATAADALSATTTDLLSTRLAAIEKRADASNAPTPRSRPRGSQGSPTPGVSPRRNRTTAPATGAAAWATPLAAEVPAATLTRTAGASTRRWGPAPTPSPQATAASATRGGGIAVALLVLLLPVVVLVGWGVRAGPPGAAGPPMADTARCGGGRLPNPGDQAGVATAATTVGGAVAPDPDAGHQAPSGTVTGRLDTGRPDECDRR